LAGNRERLRQRLYTELRAFGVDESDLPRSNAIIDPVLVVVGCSGYRDITPLFSAP
jgi:hypothetical protein